MKDKKTQHQPVLLAEVLTGLAISPSGIYIDGTMGRGGHTEAILKQLDQNGQLIAFDKDPAAVKSVKEKLGADPRIILVHGSFITMQQVAKQRNLIGKIKGILLDLGVSSPQLDEPERGFSFLQDGPLDMRMDNSSGITAAQWIATAKEAEIAEVLHDFGEERYARRIARAIILARIEEDIITTGKLSTIVSKANPAWEKGKHPATRAFQAIRIFVNQELNELQAGLDQALEILAITGRLVVISFHSLEDRIVKRFMRRNSRDESLPSYLPVVHQEVRPRLRCLGRGIKPTAGEIATNPRSRSAVLRVAEKLL